MLWIWRIDLVYKSSVLDTVIKATEEDLALSEYSIMRRVFQRMQNNEIDRSTQFNAIGYCNLCLR